MMMEEESQMITIDDIKLIKKDTKLSECVIGYKCTNCHTIYEDKNDAEECCPEH